MLKGPRRPLVWLQIGVSAVLGNKFAIQQATPPDPPSTKEKPVASLQQVVAQLARFQSSIERMMESAKRGSEPASQPFPSLDEKQRVLAHDRASLRSAAWRRDVSGGELRVSLRAFLTDRGPQSWERLRDLLVDYQTVVAAQIADLPKGDPPRAARLFVKLPHSDWLDPLTAQREPPRSAEAIQALRDLVDRDERLSDEFYRLYRLRSTYDALRDAPLLILLE
jgi:hypothetical protein